MKLYLVGAYGAKGLAFVKVGVTSDIDQRIKTLQTGQAFEVRLIYAWQCKSRLHAFDHEAQVLQRFAKNRVRGEWYRHYMFHRLASFLQKKLGPPALKGERMRREAKPTYAPDFQAELDRRLLGKIAYHGF